MMLTPPGGLTNASMEAGKASYRRMSVNDMDAARRQEEDEVLPICMTDQALG